ncbi:MAG: RNA polymerase-binding protein DksA [Desulfobacteraceae bacterium]|nr:RNA polymerase-binding protein DksA [Desulfobacteraceae bacterium]
MNTETIKFFKQELMGRMDQLLFQTEQAITEFMAQPPQEIENIDRASSNADQAFKLRIWNRENKLIKKVKEALKRLEDGSYGICELCEEEISLKRLEARPVTTKCIKCKQKEEQLEQLTK